MTYNALGFLVVSILSLLGGLVLSRMPFNRFHPRLILLAIFARLVGSLARYDLMRFFYGGISDAARYYGVGLQHARAIWSFDLSFLTPDFWFSGPGRWWGTAFMDKLSGLVLAVIGPTMRGEFVVFSMISFAGLYCIALAVYRMCPTRAAIHYAAWIWYWPSLWFWPSSTGKEAVTILAIGICVLSYSRRSGALRWLPYFLGLALAFAIRPHVAAAIVMATLIALWVSTWTRFTLRRIVEMVFAILITFAVFFAMAAQFGIEADLEGVEEFVDQRSSFTLRGGSQLEELPSGATAVFEAFVNTWMRPFPWDVHNLMALFSFLEVLVFWGLAARYWRRFGAVLRSWWRWPLLSFSLPLIVAFTLMIGLTFGNLGIIARQRTPVFPFALLLIAIPATYLLDRERLTSKPAQDRT